MACGCKKKSSVQIRRPKNKKTDNSQLSTEEKIRLIAIKKAKMQNQSS